MHVFKARISNNNFLKEKEGHWGLCSNFGSNFIGALYKIQSGLFEITILAEIALHWCIVIESITHYGHLHAAKTKVVGTDMSTLQWYMSTFCTVFSYSKLSFQINPLLKKQALFSANM